MYSMHAIHTNRTHCISVECIDFRRANIRCSDKKSKSL